MNTKNAEQRDTAQHSDLAQKLKVEQIDHQRCAHKLVGLQSELAAARKAHSDTLTAIKHEKQVWEQTKDQYKARAERLAEALKAALNDINTARRHVYEGSSANPDDMTFDAIENTLEPVTRLAAEALADWSKAQ